MSDRDARLTGLFEAYASRLHVYARRQAGPGEAEDLVSEAFVVALRRIDDLPAADDEVFPWLIATVRKLAANQRRRRDTRERYWREAVREAWHHGLGSSPEDEVAHRDECLASLASLSETDRELILLVAWEGLTNEQAAKVLGITPTALGVRLFRARQRLEPEAHPTSMPELRAVATTGE